MSKKEIDTNPKAGFYAVLYQDFRKAALKCGYALAIHGSMTSDMDLIAVAWVKEAKPAHVLVKAISDRIGETVWKEHHLREKLIHPHGRETYTLAIMGDWYIDLSIIPPNTKHK